MTGRELKDFAMIIRDEAVLEVREQGYSMWIKGFELRAIVESKLAQSLQENKDA